MPHRFYMSRTFWVACATSLGLHGAGVMIFRPKGPQAFSGYDPVSIQIVSPEIKRHASPPRRPQTDPAANMPASKPGAAAPREAPAAPAGSVGNEGATSRLARDATLLRSSFELPLYTHAATQAHYETEVVAEILVNAQGKAEDVRFTEPVRYGMEERLARAIRDARFEAARDETGAEVPGWTKIRFRLVVP